MKRSSLLSALFTLATANAAWAAGDGAGYAVHFPAAVAGYMTTVDRLVGPMAFSVDANNVIKLKPDEIAALNRGLADLGSEGTKDRLADYHFDDWGLFRPGEKWKDIPRANDIGAVSTRIARLPSEVVVQTETGAHVPVWPQGLKMFLSAFQNPDCQDILFPTVAKRLAQAAGNYDSMSPDEQRYFHEFCTGINPLESLALGISNRAVLERHRFKQNLASLRTKLLNNGTRHQPGWELQLLGVGAWDGTTWASLATRESKRVWVASNQSAIGAEVRSVDVEGQSAVIDFCQTRCRLFLARGQELLKIPSGDIVAYLNNAGLRDLVPAGQSAISYNELERLVDQRSAFYASLIDPALSTAGATPDGTYVNEYLSRVLLEDSTNSLVGHLDVDFFFNLEAAKQAVLTKTSGGR